MYRELWMVVSRSIDNVNEPSVFVYMYIYVYIETHDCNFLSLKEKLQKKNASVI